MEGYSDAGMGQYLPRVRRNHVPPTNRELSCSRRNRDVTPRGKTLAACPPPSRSARAGAGTPSATGATERGERPERKPFSSDDVIVIVVFAIRQCAEH